MTPRKVKSAHHHPYVAESGQHYIAVCLPYFDGPRVALAYLTAARIYTLDLSIERATGHLVYGRWLGEAMGASVHVISDGDVFCSALWGACGWQWIKKPAILQGTIDAGPQWSPPALLPSLDGSNVKGV